MKKILQTYKFDIVIIGLLLVLILGWQFFYTLEEDSTPEAIAAEFENTGNPFHGWAWNDNIGWLSFNCENTDICLTSDYSVGAEDLGDLSARIAGCAWSELAGWLCFDSPDVPPPGAPATSTMLDLTTNELSGWARFCSLADTPATCSGNNGAGWVKMRCDSECAASDYGVYMSNDQSLHGQAYSDDYGWISFNCDNKTCENDRQIFCSQDSECSGVGGPCNDQCDISSYHVAMNTNVSGYAYSSVADWISFNCNNEVECGSSTYGVHIDNEDQTFAGYAWSDNVGWISFQEESLPGSGVDYTFAGNCINGISTCDGVDDNCTACLDSSGVAYGWAKVLSYGDDGWIRLNDEGVGSYTYDVSLNGTNFEGRAWNGSDVVGGADPDIGLGWISFNCNEGAQDGTSICGVIDTFGNPIDYKVTYSEYFSYVTNNDPATTDETAGVLVNLCNNPYPSASVKNYTLGWTFSDPDMPADSQTAYQIIIDDNDTGANPPASPDFDTGVCTVIGGDCIAGPSAQNFQLADLSSNPVNYDNIYYWWVKVWDNNGGASVWQAGGSFDVEANEYPNPSNFTRTPFNFSAGEEVLFESRDMGIYYSGSSANLCNTTDCSWAWDEDPDLGIATIFSSNSSSTIIRFIDMTPTNIRLQLTSGGNTCPAPTSTDPGVRLPSWIETQ